MKFNKEKFLESEFGGELECVITSWDLALQKNRSEASTLRDLAWCQAQWEVYKMAIKHFYGIEYSFTRTDEYYGLCTEDESDWLMKKDRRLASIHTPVSDCGSDISQIADTLIQRIEEHLSEQNAVGSC